MLLLADEIAQSGDYDPSQTTIPIGFFNPYGMGITSTFGKLGPGTQRTDEPTIPSTLSTSTTSTTSTTTTSTTTTTTTTPTTTTSTTTTTTRPTTRRPPRPTVPYTRPTETPYYTSYRPRYETWSPQTTLPPFRSHTEIPTEAKIWTPSTMSVRLVPNMVNVVTIPSRPAPPRLQPSQWSSSSAETLVPAMGGLKLRAQPADSTCQQAFDDCERDRDCAWQLSYLRMSCSNEQQRCSRDKCASAMQTFVRLDKTRFVEPMMFCRCRPNDQACANLQQVMFPSCLYQTQDAPMSCTDAIRKCESEPACQSYANTFFQYCPTGTDGRCSIEIMDHCRHAIVSVRGTSLEFPCYCPVSDAQCRRLQFTMLPNNPCVEESMIRYYPGRIEHATQREPLPQPTSTGRDRQEQERERERQEQEQERQRAAYQRPVAEHTHPQQYSPPTAYPQIAITYTEPAMSDPWGLTKADDERRSPPREHQPSQSAGRPSSDDGRTDINDPWGIMDRSRSTEIGDITNESLQGGRSGQRGRERYEVSSPSPQRYDERPHHSNNNRPSHPTTDNRSRQPPTTTARASTVNSRPSSSYTTTTTATTTAATTRRPFESNPTTKYPEYSYENNQRPNSNTDFRETNVWPAVTADSGDRPPWETTTPTPPPTTTTPYVTYAPPPAGGCHAKDTSGNMLVHYKGYIVRRYQDYSGQCSSWCLCDEDEQLECHKLPCLPDGDCEAPLTTIGFGDRLYIKDRGACTCQSGNFICDTPEDMPELDAGLYLLVGYSRLEVQWLRQQVPNEILDSAGFISDDNNVIEDIGARLQVALERLMPKDLQCRIMLPSSPIAITQSDDNAIFQVSWFGSEPLGANETVVKKPTWHTGELEKVCVDHVQRLVQEFLTGQAMRYQLVLSTVKQIRVLDLLPILRTDAAVPLYPFSIVILVFCSITVVAMQTLLIA
uniref:GDNF/GAS1 domain-containing protein n=1 Tax=Plectus sambesii TaxID=2011161 RepID=A0A914WML8_9BILA